MNTPDLNRTVETFIKIPMNPSATRIQIWQDYLDLVRFTVIPLVKTLVERGIVEWYSFLVHGRTTGVPTEADENALYVHLRLALAPSGTQQELEAHLPDVCCMTREMPLPPPGKLDNIRVNALAGGKVENGWRVLGESSQWVLGMLNAHDPTSRIPPDNVAQLLHYLGNQLLVKFVGIPMP